MADLDDEDDELVVTHDVDDAPVPNPDAGFAIAALEHLGPGWASAKRLAATLALLCFVTLALARHGDAGPRDNLLAQVVAAAQGGDVRAQTLVGIMYENGVGVGRDPVKALEWFQMAASRDDSNGHRLVGRAYADGRGVARDEAQALLAFHRGALAGLRAFVRRPVSFKGGPQGALSAAQRGQQLAQILVARMYLTGHGVEADDQEAARWLNAAAASGPSGADELLGLMFQEGRGGLPRDPGQALQRYRSVAQSVAEGSMQSLAITCIGWTGRPDCKTGP